MFNLYADLIIYSMTLKSPNGELSLEIVFYIVIFGTFSELFFIHLKLGTGMVMLYKSCIPARHSYLSP